MAHLSSADRNAYLSGLAPGSNIDHRGTTFSESLFKSLLDALRDPETSNPRIGRGWFDSATFEGITNFDSATFEDAAVFDSAVFHDYVNFNSVTFNSSAWFFLATFEDARFDSAAMRGTTSFSEATFQGDTVFNSATFEEGASFERATFSGDAYLNSASFQLDAIFRYTRFTQQAEFNSATFGGLADFDRAICKGEIGFQKAIFEQQSQFRGMEFHQSAWFDSAIFKGRTWFSLATFKESVTFAGAEFEQADALGPLVCAGEARLSGAIFGRPVTLLLAAQSMVCRRTKWSSTAELRLRYASVDLSHAVFEYPVTIASDDAPWVLSDGTVVSEDALDSASDASVRITSLRGVDAAHLVLANVDLSSCLFTGTVHLDQIRMEGSCRFSGVPSGTGWRGIFPVRFTRRRSLAEEHHWRARQPRAMAGWNSSEAVSGLAGPVQLSPVYRALRKAFEDGKNEPGAADFYYGEMEMRRHDPDETSPAERKLLYAYWALSGYGLRAGRALGWLSAAMIATVAVMMLWGLPTDDPKPVTHGRQSGQNIRLTTDTPAPVNPTGPLRERATTERFEKSLRVVINSVVFRSSGQDLTTAGTYTEMTSRIAEPVLLGLAILAIRNRVKR
ncbi:pentapeptide repeat-containing protein (plasmid) [Streptomyces anulatus]|uniref:pentapeptide repeat-containing protein n=1 Tax=Streptomyces TaxID=1883 RepID=UPI00211D74AF|nr:MULTISPECIES: pentapeptide repeat-containing protein [Streptomyces]WSC66822.1 pentapeptide repeat-containing protein [Streptomyces anulatus]